MGEIRRRRGYLDWTRGLAVLIMIEAHLLDSWTRAADRETLPFRLALMVAGLGAPMFLLLAGTAVPLSAAAKARRTGAGRSAWRLVARRGLQIFALAFLFRIQAWALGWGPVRTLLKVDILNIMGPSIVAAAALWGMASGASRRMALLGAACVATAFATPVVRSTPLLTRLPDALEAYLRPVAGLTNFAFFPAMGYVFAGGVLGVCVAACKTADEEIRANIVFGVAGALLALTAYGLSFLPPLHQSSTFWSSSPAFFGVQLGILILILSLAFAWNSWRGAGRRWSPLQQLGRTSLFIYWIHVEMVYGLISLPLHNRLTFWQACGALGLFMALMLACSVAKERAARWWQAHRTGARTPAVA